MKIKIVSTKNNISEINQMIISDQFDKSQISEVKDPASFGFDMEVLNQIMLIGNFTFMIGTLALNINNLLKARKNQKIVIKTPLKTVVFETTDNLDEDQIKNRLEQLSK